jgi:hypothetical protein
MAQLMKILKAISWIENIANSREHILTPMNNSTLALTYFNLSQIAGKEAYRQKGLELIQKLLKKQNEDGSWNEIYPNINAKSTLATAYVGLMLAKINSYSLLENVNSYLIKATEYVVNNEMKPGYFLKSEINDKDTVNVNLVCALFLLNMYKHFQRDDLLKISLRTVKKVMKAQLENGAFPYYSDEKRYLTPLHYHVFITRLLADYFLLLPDDKLYFSLQKAVGWLSNKVETQGRINWEGDLGVWVYRSFSTYGNAIYDLVFASALIDNNLKKLIKPMRNYVLSRQSPDGSFPESDIVLTIHDFLTDMKNIGRLILYRDFSSAFLLSRGVLVRKHPTTLFNKVTINIQLVEALTSSIALFKRRVPKTLVPSSELFELGEPCLDNSSYP